MSERNPTTATDNREVAGSAAATAGAPNFIREIIREDLKTNKYNGRV